MAVCSSFILQELYERVAFALPVSRIALESLSLCTRTRAVLLHCTWHHSVWRSCTYDSAALAPLSLLQLYDWQKVLRKRKWIPSAPLSLSSQQTMGHFHVEHNYILLTFTQKKTKVSEVYSDRFQTRWTNSKNSICQPSTVLFWLIRKSIFLYLRLSKLETLVPVRSLNQLRLPPALALVWVTVRVLALAL